MEESNQQQILLQIQHRQQLQHRQQQMFLMQHLQKQQQQQQQAATSMFPSSVDAHLRPPLGLIQNRPVNPNPQNVNPFPNFGPDSIQHTNNNSQQNVMMTMMMRQQKQQQEQNMMMMKQQQQQQEQQEPNRPLLNQIELQFAYQDAWRICHPDFKRPFASLEDACERLLPYHVVADYEAEEDERIIVDSDTTRQTLSRSQQWDNNITSKVGQFAATFEKQAQAFNTIARKRSHGELRSEEKLMIEQVLLLEERNACIEAKSEMDREAKAQETRIKMAALARPGQVEMMGRSNPLMGNAIGNHGGQGLNMNRDEMMMMMVMNGWENHHNNNNGSQREEKGPLESFLNDEGNERFGANGEFDLNIR